ncbi:MAG: ABC transporter permease [Minisyncoccota bacterium]
MRTRHTLQTAWRGLRANTSRSVLTTLGIIIGIASIILIVSLGQGAQALVVHEVEGMGGNMIVVRPGRQPTSLANTAQTIFADSLKDTDVAALRQTENVPQVIDVVPVVFVPGNASHEENTYYPTILGWSAGFMGSLFHISPAEGDYFSDADIRAKASVAVIGSKVATELFPATDPIGKTIKIKNHTFQVVAVLPQKGQVAFFNLDEVVIVPYTTAQTYLLGINYYNEIMVRVTNETAVDGAVHDITTTLRGRHNITDPSKDDFFIITQKAVVDQIGTILSVLTLFLSAVVAISLVVGGIGVMNIMLVSVTERTREIGLRKALGAQNRDILLQFLTEAVLLTAAGGIIGILIGTALSVGIGFLVGRTLSVDWPIFNFPYRAAALALGVSATVGLVFGMYPARKASKKSPMEALRYE